MKSIGKLAYPYRVTRMTPPPQVAATLSPLPGTDLRRAPAAALRSQYDLIRV